MATRCDGCRPELLFEIEVNAAKRLPARAQPGKLGLEAGSHDANNLLKPVGCNGLGMRRGGLRR